MKHIIRLSEVIGACLLIFSTGIFLIRPHAQNFVEDIHKEENITVCKKLDSLIVKQIETQQKIDKIIYVMAHTLPEDERKAVMKKYKDYKIQ